MAVLQRRLQERKKRKGGQEWEKERKGGGEKIALAAGGGDW